MKLKFNKTLSEWLTSKLQLIIRNEENFEDKFKLSYTPARLLFFSFIAFVVVFVLGFFIAAKIYNRTILSGQDAALSRKVVTLTTLVDSLNQKIDSKNDYIESIKKVLGGEVKYFNDEKPAELKKEAKKVSNYSESVNLDKLEQADIKMRNEFESGNSMPGAMAQGREINLKNLVLFPPLKGMVSDKYNSKDKHYGVDLVSAKDEPIKSISDGTVIFSSWTDETGNVIAIQHQSELVSIYKHCSVLLKKVGNFVNAGEIIAIIGNSGENTTGPHLHFELWYKGNPMNPEDFVSF